MNEDQKYLFDLTGYLIIENALTAEEVAHCNAAIDHHIEGLRERDTSLSGGSAALAGTAHRMDMGACSLGRNLGVSRSEICLSIRKLNLALKRF